MGTQLSDRFRLKTGGSTGEEAGIIFLFLTEAAMLRQLAARLILWM